MTFLMNIEPAPHGRNGRKRHIGAFSSGNALRYSGIEQDDAIENIAIAYRE